VAKILNIDLEKKVFNSEFDFDEVRIGYHQQIKKGLRERGVLIRDLRAQELLAPYLDKIEEHDKRYLLIILEGKPQYSFIKSFRKFYLSGYENSISLNYLRDVLIRFYEVVIQADLPQRENLIMKYLAALKSENLLRELEKCLFHCFTYNQFYSLFRRKESFTLLSNTKLMMTEIPSHLMVPLKAKAKIGTLQLGDFLKLFRRIVSYAERELIFFSNREELQEEFSITEDSICIQFKANILFQGKNSVSFLIKSFITGYIPEEMEDLLLPECKIHLLPFYSSLKKELLIDSDPTKRS
jgi:hypothetical protein